MHGREEIQLDTVTQVYIIENKVNAAINELSEFKQERRIEQIDHVRQIDLDLARVDIVEQAFHGPRRDVLDVDLAETALLEITGEHGAKVSARRAQDHLVTGKLDSLDVDRYVREEVLVAEFEQIVDQVRRAGRLVGVCAARRVLVQLASA